MQVLQGISSSVLCDLVDQLRSNLGLVNRNCERTPNRQGVKQGVRRCFGVALAPALETPCTSGRLSETL